MTDLARAVPLRRPAPASPSRRLRVVEEPVRRRRPKLAYGIIAVGGAVAIALAQMGLSILTTQGTYEMAALTQQQRDLTYEKQILADDVAGLNSPQYLAANAAALGMVINESPSYLRLSDGAIIGAGQAAAGTSAVDALNRGAVQNSLIADTPLITAPEATIQGAPLVTEETGAGATTDGTGSTTPPPITDGLPTPATR
jgi:hypothetical protein